MTATDIATKQVYEVLDLGEDGEAWAIAGHHDDETALRSVVVHLWELGAIDGIGWCDGLRVGEVLVRHERGEWVDVDPDNDPDGDGTFERRDDGEPWTFVTY